MFLCIVNLSHLKFVVVYLLIIVIIIDIAVD